jgi:hypothetical protein
MILVNRIDFSHFLFYVTYESEFESPFYDIVDKSSQPTVKVEGYFIFMKYYVLLLFFLIKFCTGLC